VVNFFLETFETQKTVVRIFIQFYSCKKASQLSGKSMDK